MNFEHASVLWFHIIDKDFSADWTNGCTVIALNKNLKNVKKNWKKIIRILKNQ